MAEKMVVGFDARLVVILRLEDTCSSLESIRHGDEEHKPLSNNDVSAR